MKNYGKIAVLSIACLFIASADAKIKTRAERQKARQATRAERQKARQARKELTKKRVGHNYTFTNSTPYNAVIYGACRGVNCPEFSLPAGGVKVFRPIEHDPGKGLAWTGICLKKHSISVKFPQIKKSFSVPVVFVPTEGYTKLEQSIENAVENIVTIGGESVQIAMSAAGSPTAIANQVQDAAGDVGAIVAAGSGGEKEEIEATKVVVSQDSIDNIAKAVSNLPKFFSYWNLVNVCRDRDIMLVETDKGFVFIVKP